jgi:WD40 repeat protein
MKRLPSFGLGLPCAQNASPKRVGFLLLFLSAGMLLAQPCQAGAIGFEETGSLAAGRYNHTATLLPNGKVLAAGGAGQQSSAELYDPASGTWVATGSTGALFYNFTATLLPNGKVLAAGGGPNVIFQSATTELYDPASGTWTETGSLGGKRSNHTATLLLDGKVLVVGGDYIDVGYGGFSIASAELYDPASGTWTATGSLATARGRHTATLLPNGKVLVAGGDNNYYGMVVTHASCELYDPQTGTWTSTGPLGDARSSHTGTLLPNNKVLVAGGSTRIYILASAELYDPQSGTWTSTGPLGHTRSSHTATLLSDNKVLVAGGYNDNTAELYDLASGSWTATGSLGTARDLHTATLLPNNEVLVAGGRIGNDRSASAELYGPTQTLLNISTRVGVLTGDKVPIGGFIITGTEPKTVIIRGIGPSLPVPGALADPVIEVHGPSGQLLGINDNWRDAATRQQISDSGLAPTNDLESALWGIILPGAYTVILSGKDGGTGVGLVEVYDLDRTVDSELGNISTRGFVDIGDNVMIGGLIVGGGGPTGAARVIVRALGPSVPVAGALADPTLELYDGNGVLMATNDDWKTRPDGTSQQAEIEATTIPPTNDLDSALVRTLPAGNYTAIVRGKSNTTGVGLVEAYHLQ